MAHCLLSRGRQAFTLAALFGLTLLSPIDASLAQDPAPVPPTSRESYQLQGWTPLQLSLFDPIQTSHRNIGVAGLRLSLLNGRNIEVRGIDLGLRNESDVFAGIGLSLVNSTSDLTGIHAGLINHTSGNCAFLQVGIFNRCGLNVSGLQIGLINSSPNVRGLQIGLLNFHDDGLLPVTPIINGGW